jgi:hypothetical protein
MDVENIYEERKEASILIKELVLKINKKLNNLGILDKEEIKYLKENIDENNISIRDMNKVQNLMFELKNNERLMNYLKINDEEFYDELNIKYSYICFYNNLFYSDIEQLIIKKIEVYNSKNNLNI